MMKFRPNVVKNDYAKLMTKKRKKQSVCVILVKNMWHLTQRSWLQKILLPCRINVYLSVSISYPKTNVKKCLKVIGDLVILKGNDHLLLEIYSFYSQHTDTVKIQINHGNATMHFIYTSKIKK